ncbi:unnamed protein product, partial [marine sediment metagenome]
FRFPDRLIASAMIIPNNFDSMISEIVCQKVGTNLHDLIAFVNG